MPNSTPWRQYLCKACGYVYDEQFGDPDGGLPAGTRFEDIPDNWQCPLCGVTKADFEYINPRQTCQQPTFTGINQQKGVVIIGAGLAGWSVVDALRHLDKGLPITLISADSACRYHKPMLSAGFSQKKSAADLIRTSGQRAATTANIHLLADTFVLDIDSQKKVLHTTRGNVEYNKLVIAIGAVPVYPPNIDKTQAWHVNHLSSYNKLFVKLSHPKHIAIIGAGMVGVELAEDLCQAGHTITLLDKNHTPLSNLLPPMIGKKITQSLTKLGITIKSNTTVRHVVRTQTAYELTITQNGQDDTIYADEIIVATGLAVDGRLPTRAGLEFNLNAGIFVDEHLATSVADIYAIGDCIAIDGKPCRYVAPHRTQAATIAHAITQTPHTGYHHIAPIIRLKNKSIGVQATGNPTGKGDWHITENSHGKLIMTLYQEKQIVATATVTEKF